MRQWMSVRSSRSGWAFNSRKQPRCLAHRNDPGHVDVVRLALGDETPRRMRQNGEMRPLHRAQDALGLLLARQVELAVNGGDDEIELAQHVVGKIELAVVENIDLDALEQLRAALAGIDAGRSAPISWRSRLASRPCAMASRREWSVMARYSIAARARRFRQLLQRVVAICRVGCGRADRPAGPQARPASAGAPPPPPRSRRGFPAAPAR